ncbi:hypothetical protein DFP72DRAFT_895249 [Ephemerocybe angulata]|uniref:Nephrocystin 3-like N-terminal domain-containing protein n=1 Tax=Ephemerocybe angulata TaxID=980116 RepID=A0A8H6I0Q7_9AGAR|nr:hypothetical protein DFP72DRAFT_895249 [Tulosesus angulatus]
MAEQPAAPQGSHMFNNAQNFTLENCTMIAVSQDSKSASLGSELYSMGMKELGAHISDAAPHNSSERGDAPKCHKDTRKAIQSRILNWIESDAPDERPVIWLTGPAGTGKTAILQTLSEKCEGNETLAASFFFSYRAPKTRNKKYLIPTLAYQLAQNVPNMGPAVTKAIAQDPKVFSKNIRSQMEILILRPLVEATKGGRLRPKCRVIIIDALDECDPEITKGKCDSASNRIAKEEDHRQILKVLWSAAIIPSFPFRIMIGSRPEPAIRLFFTEQPLRNAWHIALDEQCGNPNADIATLLRYKLLEIGKKFGIAAGTQGWDSEDVIQALVSRASGQFIYVATILRWIEEAERKNPFLHLDELYARVISSSRDPSGSVVWLRIIHFLSLTSNLPASFVDRFLESKPGDVERIVGTLHSVLCVPSSEDRDSKRYRFYHLSFPEFLASSSRSKELYVPDELWVNHFVLRYLSFFKEATLAENTEEMEKCASIQVPDLTCIALCEQVKKVMLVHDIPSWVKHTVNQKERRCSSWNLATFYDWVHCRCRWYAPCNKLCRRWHRAMSEACRQSGWSAPTKLFVLHRGRYTDRFHQKS